jgi:hypothetical protein
VAVEQCRDYRGSRLGEERGGLDWFFIDAARLLANNAPIG